MKLHTKLFIVGNLLMLPALWHGQSRRSLVVRQPKECSVKPTDRLADWIYDHLGTDWCGNAHVPGDEWRIDFGPDAYPSLAVLKNDGFELWLGMSYEWHTHMPRKQARQLAWWLLRCEVALWFGLRRKVWYWALFRRVKRHKKRAA